MLAFWRAAPRVCISECPTCTSSLGLPELPRKGGGQLRTAARAAPPPQRLALTRSRQACSSGSVCPLGCSLPLKTGRQAVPFGPEARCPVAHTARPSPANLAPPPLLLPGLPPSSCPLPRTAIAHRQSYGGCTRASGMSIEDALEHPSRSRMLESIYKGRSRSKKIKFLVKILFAAQVLLHATVCRA